MRFWDASALAPLYVAQAHTTTYQQWLKQDPHVIFWWGSRIECVSAFCRLNREGKLNADDLNVSIQALEEDSEGWREVEPCEPVRREAVRILRVHALRLADALQLAAALIATDHAPRRLPFVCADRRLTLAAQKEGFETLG